MLLVNEEVAAELRKAADTIESGYWFRGGDDKGRLSLRVYADGSTFDEGSEGSRPIAEGGCLITTPGNFRAKRAILLYLTKGREMNGFGEVYRLNDNRPADLAGRDWAIRTLREVADWVEQQEKEI